QLTEVSLNYLHVNTLLTKMVGIMRVQKMFQQATERVKSLQLKWSSMSLDDPELRPSRDINEILHFGISLSDNLPNAEQAVKIESALRGKLGQFTLKKLEENIGNSKTRCIPCKLIFANAAEYFGHLLTFYHLREADPLDLITMLVNVQKREVARLQLWPELPAVNPFNPLSLLGNFSALWGRPIVTD
ncbi:hypothetical protein PMAYCL1PPCAC_00451, partial [Pristionchus mayeri]